MTFWCGIQSRMIDRLDLEDVKEVVLLQMSTLIFLQFRDNLASDFESRSLSPHFFVLLCDFPQNLLVHMRNCCTEG